MKHLGWQGTTHKERDGASLSWDSPPPLIDAYFAYFGVCRSRMAAPTSNLSREPVPPSGHAITAESGAKWQVRDLSGLTLNTLPHAIAKKY